MVQPTLEEQESLGTIAGAGYVGGRGGTEPCKSALKSSESLLPVSQSLAVKIHTSFTTEAAMSFFLAP